jgi:A/G-specific adenine glycosylase
MPPRPDLPALPPPASRRRFRRWLLDWYSTNGRDLPWRRTRDPYHILVSEIMLQQTQVDRVLPKYHEWLEKYPSLSALAAAEEEDVSSTWRPLGYNIRPRRLHAIARESVARFGGTLPSDEETLRSFKGIGAYRPGPCGASRSASAPRFWTRTWHAFCSGFSSAVAIRGRTPCGSTCGTSPGPFCRSGAFDFNQALMDFGATLCTARKPKCLLCPMKNGCAAYPHNPANERPGRPAAR